MTSERKRIQPARWYSEREVAGIVGRVQTQAHTDAGRWFDMVYKPYMTALTLLEKTIDFVHTNALYIDGNSRQTARDALAGVDGELSRRYTEVIGCLRALGDSADPVIFQELNAVVPATLEALQRFLRGIDDGQALYAIARARRGAFELVAMARSDIDYGGRPSGMAPWRRWLGQRITELEEKHPAATAHDIGKRIRAELRAAHRDPIQDEVLARLEARGDLAQYIRQTKRAYLDEFGPGRRQN